MHLLLLLFALLLLPQLALSIWSSGGGGLHDERPPGQQPLKSLSLREVAERDLAALLAIEASLLEDAKNGSPHPREHFERLLDLAAEYSDLLDLQRSPDADADALLSRHLQLGFRIVALAQQCNMDLARLRPRDL